MNIFSQRYISGKNFDQRKRTLLQINQIEMQNLYTGVLMREKFPCIVCSLETNSVNELHNHQKYRHTTEELSLSVICLVHYMCFKNEALGLDVASRYPLVLKNQVANYHFCQLHNQSNNNSSNDCAKLNPTPYNGGKTSKTRTLFRKTTKAKVLEQRNQALQYSLNISAGDFEKSNKKVIGEHFNTMFLSNWEVDLGKVPEISDETFLNCVNGICKDLEVIGKPVMSSRQGFLKSTKKINPGQTGNGKKIARFQKNFALPTRRTSTKGLQRSKTFAESQVSYQSKVNINKKHQESEPIDYSTRKASFSQSVQFHILNKNNETLGGDMVENLNPQKVHPTSFLCGNPRV